MSANFTMIKTELSTLAPLTTHCSYTIAALLVIALQQKKEVALTTELARTVQLSNEGSVVRNAKAKVVVKFHIQKLAQIT
ncbi:hypothetical protein TVAG_116400 [Trichomonas vaginalis G3]|uniref:Uncharacterized protein n=1 Tax=Trichomonas vaginalis (strain ATCC PRA-98 / G3) TaxID=412133 RepID=A2G3Z4_TRIV3|nr:hypothetical protein TVAGG3_0212030 [Trichomonas vaginalis G3]EAX88128.1 hypothetical protein TVAG_116400 [Trichomonas vaginalis G3]KAI5551302.1 hypothetical protein TVAGG3_0212030 [Trichomonas vaginalis G3]|eukprot:XP_001301058.1 hypothetical protein [Trichomonas vaginalis G3]